MTSPGAVVVGVDGSKPSRKLRDCPVAFSADFSDDAYSVGVQLKVHVAS